MRLGDSIDDYCSRCKLSTGHAVVAMVGEEVKKVRCATCGHEHNYRKNRGGKQPLSKQQAFDRILASLSDQIPGGPPKSKK
ncbi:MAG TPA: hypothetical protein VEG08_10465 [Terriglobales bacterium]|nr:hypothetical protein [Terriglobales bacterium]